jgi:hypothetical protein
MPIRPELRHFYRGKAYEAFRARIVERAKNRCEQCGKPNHRRVWVYSTVYSGGKVQYWTATKHDDARWRCCLSGELERLFRRWGAEWHPCRRIRVICTLAHLNHTPGDDREENLMFLCQWCHLNYDRLHHKETRSQRKDAARPLLSDVRARGEALGFTGDSK